MIRFDRVRSSDDLKKFITALLDRIDRNGVVPKNFSMKLADCPDADALRAFFGHDYIKVIDEKSIRLDLNRLTEKLPELINQLYQQMNRQPRNLKSEKTEIVESLKTIISDALKHAQHAKTDAFAGWLARQLELCQKGRGELLQLLEQQGDKEVLTLLKRLMRGFVLLQQSSEPMRLSHFGLAVTGDTKSCRTGTPLLRKFIEILAEFDSDMANELSNLDCATSEARHRAVLDLTRLQADGSATQVLAFGHIVFAKGSKTLSYVADHAQLGEPVVLSWQQLNNARIESIPAAILTVENETSFYDLIEKCDPAQTAVFCTMGQANRLLIKILRDIGGRASSFRHCGDLDRSGVLILDSLRRRTGLTTEPFLMQPELLQKNLETALPLPAHEKQLIAGLLERRPKIICADLLRAILQHSRWLEQETLTAKTG